MGDGSFIVALDRKTGEEVVARDRDEPAQLGDAARRQHRTRDELIASGAEVVIAYDPATARSCGAPTARAAIPSRARSRRRARVPHAGSQAKVVMAMKPAARRSKDRVVWRYNKGAAYVPSPIAVGDYST
jgi:hypothetical protein